MYQRLTALNFFNFFDAFWIFRLINDRFHIWVLLKLCWTRSFGDNYKDIRDVFKSNLKSDVEWWSANI